MIARFRNDRGGAVAMILALALPVMAGAVGAAIEYGTLFSRRSALQKAADAAAIAAAGELTLAAIGDSQVASVAQSVALANAGETDPATLISTEVLNQGSWVRVRIQEPIRSVMGRIMALPASTLDVEATAQLSGRIRLCMLALDPKSSDALYLHKSAQITADTCLVQSNSLNQNGLHIEDNAAVSAALICSSGGYKGGKGTRLSATPTVDCPPRTDPLASRVPPPAIGCKASQLVVDGKKTPVVSLSPGVYCGGLKVTQGAQVTLQAGIYVIDNGPLIVEESASLSGTYVGFYFTGDKGGLLFDTDTTISLAAPKDGAMAGLLFFENRTVSAPIAPPDPLKGAPPPPPPGSPAMRQYRIVSDNARNLLGTIYLPAGRLIIDASKPVADRSAYTVVLARQIELFDGPNLFLNTNYGASDVPVPDGVGPMTRRGIALVR